MKITCDCGKDAFRADLRLPREPGAFQVTRSIGIRVTIKKRDIESLPVGPIFTVTCDCGRELMVVEIGG